MEKEFLDITGKVIKIGDVVATNHIHYKDRLFICDVIGFTPEKIRLQTRPGQHSWGNEIALRTQAQCVVLNFGE
jgi:hypothetical protein